MRKTIQARILTVLVIALSLIALTGGLSLYYLSKVSQNVAQVISTDIRVIQAGERLKALFYDIKKLERIYLDSLKKPGESVDIEGNLNDFEETIQTYRELTKTEQTRETLSQLADLFSRYQKALLEAGEKQKTVALTKEIEELIGAFLSLRYFELDRHQEEVGLLIANANRNMLLLLFICIGGGIVLIILAPSRVTIPFKRYISAINEVQELKFDTMLPVSGDNEVSQLGRSINRLIGLFRSFDEIKQKRILFEARKQRVLANMVDLGVMMLTVEGQILFLNAQLAKILNLTTSNYQHKDFHLVSLSQELKEMVEDVLKKQQKVDSRMMILSYHEKKEEKAVEVNVDAGLVRNYQGEVVNVIMTFEDITNPLGQSVFKRISIKEQELV